MPHLLPRQTDSSHPPCSYSCGCSYDSTDLAAILYRFSELKVDTAIYVTDAGQAMHFHMIFEAARMAGADWMTVDDKARQVKLRPLSIENLHCLPK